VVRFLGALHDRTLSAFLVLGVGLTECSDARVTTQALIERQLIVEAHAFDGFQNKL
jgi:hypothetical protein